MCMPLDGGYELIVRKKGEGPVGRFFRALYEERKLIGIATLILFVGLLLGYVNAEGIHQVLRQSGMYDALEQLVQRIHENPDFLSVFGLIFFNNARAAVTTMGLGIFFGVYPVLMLASNGILLGVILHQSSLETGVHPLILFVTKVLPHGILELPAIIIAAAYGMRLGITFVRWIFSFLVPGKRAAGRAEWRRLFDRIPAAVILVLLLLILAAGIESALIITMGVQGGGLG
jgi:stage II sporulation protein M